MTEKLTVRELVRQLGGATEVAAALGISSQAVCNWYVAGIARRHEVALYKRCVAMGVPWVPASLADLLIPPRPNAPPPDGGNQHQAAA